MAICHMGTRHGGPTQEILKRRTNTPTSRSRQVHQMDRSSTNHQLNSPHDSQLHQVNHLQIQSTTQHHHRQWYKLHSSKVPKLLSRARHQNQLRISRTPAVQRPSGESKRPSMRRNKETTPSTTRTSRRQLRRGTSRSTMEPAHHPKQLDPIYTFLLGIRGRSSTVARLKIQSPQNLRVRRGRGRRSPAE